MGQKGKAFKYNGTRTEIRAPLWEITREELKECVEKGINSLENSKYGMPLEKVAVVDTAIQELRMHAETEEYAVIGSFHHYFVEEGTGERINCGCPLAMISDPVSNSIEYKNDGRLTLDDAMNFFSAYDAAMSAVKRSKRIPQNMSTNTVKVVG